MKTNETESNKVENANAEATNNGKAAHSSSNASGGRHFASSPLVITLLIVLLAAVCIQGALLAGVYFKDKSEAKATISGDDEAPALVAKPDKDSGNQANPPARLAPSPLGSMLTDDFFSDDWQPFAEMARMRKHMDQLFEDSFGRFRSMPGFDEDWLDMGTAFSGHAAIDEKDGNYIVTVDLPGADEATLDIKSEDGVLSIRGERDETNEVKDNDGNVIRHSQSNSTFQRSFSLPEDAESTGMKSDYKDGVLTITIPKSK